MPTLTTTTSRTAVELAPGELAAVLAMLRLDLLGRRRAGAVDVANAERLLRGVLRACGSIAAMTTLRLGDDDRRSVSGVVAGWAGAVATREPWALAFARNIPDVDLVDLSRRLSEGTR